MAMADLRSGGDCIHNPRLVSSFIRSPGRGWILFRRLDCTAMGSAPSCDVVCVSGGIEGCVTTPLCIVITITIINKTSPTPCNNNKNICYIISL